MSLPNLYLVGAAKAGTTSLGRYLSEHPEIVVSKPKEPKYVTSQFLNLPQAGPNDAAIDANRVKDLSEYEALFHEDEGVSIRCDASADNLYYHEAAIPIIQHLAGDPKILILLREPVSRALSAYRFQYQQGRETLGFSQALEEEGARLAKNWEFIWAYRRGGFYADAVAAYKAAFTEVGVFLLEDLEDDPSGTMDAIQRFLGVARRDLVGSLPTRHNASRDVHRSITLQRWRGGHGSMGRLIGSGRQFLPQEFRRVLRRRVDRWMASGTLGTHEGYWRERMRLRKVYGKDVDMLRVVINRSLTGWPSASA